MKSDLANLRKKYDDSKVSKMWNAIPIAGTVYYFIQKKNRKKYKE